MTDAPGPTTTLDREATRQTVLWGVGLNLVTKLASIALSMVLARLISPEEFGQYGTVSAVILLIMSFSMQPFANHLYHQKDTQPEDFERHLAFGTLLHLVLFVVANLLASAMHFLPKLSVIAIYVHVGSIAILFNIPRIYYATCLRLQLRWRTMRLLGLVSLAIYAAASIGIALMGYGVYALLAQNLVVPLPYVVAIYFDRGVQRGMNFDWRAYRSAFRFGLARTGSGVLSQGQTTLESYMLTLLAGFAPLGLFLRARGLAALATTWLTEQVNAMLYPSMAQLQPRSVQSRRMAGLLMRLGFWTTAPLVLVGCIAGEGAIRLLYGPQWLAAAPFLAPLLVAALAMSQVGIARLVVLTNDGARRTLFLDAASAGANLLGLAILPLWGLLAYANYLAAANVVFLAGVTVAMLRRELIGPADVARTFGPVLAVAAAALALAVAGGPQLTAWFATPVGLVGAAAAISLATLLLVRLLDREGLDTLCGLMPLGGHLRRGLLLRRATP